MATLRKALPRSWSDCGRPGPVRFCTALFWQTAIKLVDWITFAAPASQLTSRAERFGTFFNKTRLEKVLWTFGFLGVFGWFMTLFRFALSQGHKRGHTYTQTHRERKKPRVVRVYGLKCLLKERVSKKKPEKTTHQSTERRKHTEKK